MFKCINGWTKAEMIEVIKNRPNYKCTYAGTCFYRNGNGGKCAIGAFIPDDLYHPRIESQRACGVFDTYSGLSFPLDGPALNAFQVIHDTTKHNDINAELIKWVEANVE